MIKSNELRIGNLVCLNGIRRVISIDNMIQVDGISAHFHDVPGILLTEEWLLKFGGEIREFSIGVVLDRFRFLWKEEYKYWYVIASDPGGAYMTKIEFVHELQNFYQSMTGKELTYA